MRFALALVATSTIAARAWAQAPEPTPAQPAPEPAPGQPAPAPEPKLDPAYGEPTAGPETSGPRRQDIVVRFHPDRTRNNVTLLAALGGAGVVFGAVGVYFHLDWRSANDDVAADRYTGHTWSAERQDTYERAQRSSLAAGVCYGIGAGFLLATAIAYMATEPGMETRIIHPHDNGAPLARRLPRIQVGPTRGGAVVGSAWSF
jgi:hypothetical protein